MGEIYRVPNVDENISLERYEAVLGKLQKPKKNIILGTYQNFDFLKLQTHSATASLLDTIPRPTRVTYNTVTLIVQTIVMTAHRELSYVICQIIFQFLLV